MRPSRPIKSKWRPTGRTGCRKSWTGRLIVTIEESCRIGIEYKDRFHWLKLCRRWRDANVNDMPTTFAEGN